MRKICFLPLVAVITILCGCSPVEGPRFWWDDEKKEKLPDSYMLPESPPESPVPTEPAPFIPKQLPRNEIERATKEEKAQIEKGIARAGEDPKTDRVIVPAEKYDDEEEFEEEEVEVDLENDGKVTITEDTIIEKDGNIDFEQNKE